MAALPVQAFKNVHIKALHLLPDFPKGGAKVAYKKRPAKICKSLSMDWKKIGSLWKKNGIFLAV